VFNANKKNHRPWSFDARRVQLQTFHPSPLLFRYATRTCWDLRENRRFFYFILILITRPEEKLTYRVTCERKGCETRVGVEPLRTSATQINFQVQKLLAFWLGSTSRARPCKTVMRRNNFCCLNVYININRPAWRAVIFGSFSGSGTITLLIYIADVLIIWILSTVEYFVNFACFSASFHTCVRLEFSKNIVRAATVRDFSG